MSFFQILCISFFFRPEIERPPVQLRVDPERIPINAFYHGAEISVEAVLPSQLDIVFVARGPESKIELKKKGKVWGVLWMNVNDVVFDKVPSYYALISSRPLSQLCPREVRLQNSLGYNAIEEYSECSAGESGKETLFWELVKLKERDRLFYVGEGEIEIERYGENMQKAKGKIFLPAKAPPATYILRVLGLKDGEIQVSTGKDILVTRVGVVARMAHVAESHGLLYGCVAVILAVCAGLLTGWVFGLRTGKSR